MKSLFLIAGFSFAVFSTIGSFTSKGVANDLFFVKAHSYSEARFSFLTFESRNGDRITVRTPVGDRSYLKQLDEKKGRSFSLRYSIKEFYSPDHSERKAFENHMPCQKEDQSLTCTDRLILNLK